MRIGLLWKNNYPWDVRVEKIATALAAVGHQVVILAANSEARSEREQLGPLQIRRLPARTGGRLQRWFNRVISMPFYGNPWWFRLARQVMHEEPLDLLIVRDLPLITVGLHLKRRFGIPLVLDMAENYPAMYGVAVQDGGVWLGAVRWLFKNPGLMARVERWALPQLDHVLVVVEESAQRVAALGVDHARITVVGNTPKTASLPVTVVRSTPARVTSADSLLRLVYVGFVQDGRGLEVIVRALRKLREMGRPAQFVVVGDGGYRSRLERIVTEEGVADSVQFTGWIAHERIGEYIAQADVGVIPHPKNDHTDSTIPNKLFDYMMKSLPVLVSDAAPLARIVMEERCGAVFRAGDADSAAQAIVRLASDPQRARMGERGAAAVARRYHWEFDAAVLCRAIDSVPLQQSAAVAAV